jgi:hypothetical protein
MGASGTATVDFGAFPGKSDTSVAITGQAGIVAGSLVEAWIRPVDTADHLADEHMLETLRVMAGSIVAGAGFTIYAINTSDLSDPTVDVRSGIMSGGVGTRLYGLWSVAWVWN